MMAIRERLSIPLPGTVTSVRERIGAYVELHQVALRPLAAFGVPDSDIPPECVFERVLTVALRSAADPGRAA